MRQWGVALRAYAGDFRNHFPYNGFAIPGSVRVGGQHWSWNSSTVQDFWAKYLVMDTSKSGTKEKMVARDHVVLHCPTNLWHRVVRGGYERLVGYFYLPHRDPRSATYAPPQNPNGDKWVSKKRFDENPPYNLAPILIDMKQSIGVNGWHTSAGVPFSSHVRPSGEPYGGNFLFEDGHVNWVNNTPNHQTMGLGGRLGGWHAWYGIPLNKY